MITKITGQLVALHDDTLTLKIDAFEMLTVKNGKFVVLNQ